MLDVFAFKTSIFWKENAPVAREGWHEKVAGQVVVCNMFTMSKSGSSKFRVDVGPMEVLTP